MMNKKGGTMYETGRARVTRSEFDDGLMRDNVRIDNKHQRELRVHERAKNVVSRTFEKETQLFKQKQALQKKKLSGLNSQGHKIRSSSIGAPNKPNEISSSLDPSPTNGTLSPPISEPRSLESKSPITPLILTGDNFPFHNPPDPTDEQETIHRHVSKEPPNKKEPQSQNRLKQRSLSENSQMSVPRRRLARNALSDSNSPDIVIRSTRVPNPTRGLYVDGTGRLREETVFDFLSKPKHNYEVQKRRDIRVQLEKEFSAPKPMVKKVIPTSATGRKLDSK